MIYLEHLDMQLNMLSLGHLSPSTIAPENLRLLLLEIRAHLPPYLKLPEDPNTKLLDYYRFLSCSTLMMNDRIIIVLSVPLLDFDGDYEVYKVYNLPVPSRNRSGMVVEYQLEAEALAINAERTKYTVLGSGEANKCVSKLVTFCDVKNSVYPINLSRLCIVALFMKNEESIRENCNLVVKPNARLPIAVCVTDGLWIIATQKRQRFTIVYQHSRARFTISGLSPSSLMNLAKSIPPIDLDPVHELKSSQLNN